MTNCQTQIWLLSLVSAAVVVTAIDLAGTLTACTGNLGCSLNGMCNSAGSCVCDQPWHGPSCGLLNMLPVNRTNNPEAAIYGYHPNVSSWGASIQKSDDGTWNLFVAQMKTGGLIGWGTESECVHATSAIADGPYVKSGVLIPNECHGPVVIRDFHRSGEYLLFHIGDGGETTNTSSFMHHSPTPQGPWTPANTNPGSCGMPTAGFHPNGTLFVVCGNGRAMFAADTWDSRWRKVVQLETPSGWEDPSIWWDRRENFHILFHVYALSPFSSNIEKYSGHAYSKDGLSWTFSDVEPFGGTVEFTDGTSQSFATRERPQLLFSDENRTTPIGLTSAVSPQPLGPWCDECKEKACSQCKVTPGRDCKFKFT